MNSTIVEWVPIDHFKEFQKEVLDLYLQLLGLMGGLLTGMKKLKVHAYCLMIIILAFILQEEFVIEYFQPIKRRNNNGKTTVRYQIKNSSVSQVYLSNNKSEITDYRGIPILKISSIQISLKKSSRNQ
ncbi:11440_t:CDS:2 [Dentiscutata heterogama]|uniref:11440_t:CDS:1 n=1 Tax=Dentiscutata heterogama TaxID=1316150 RepID=A0ACA9KI23_9GLOM|nr:11440_t:CDS:2 [Dentiscutata heterogama]